MSRHDQRVSKSLGRHLVTLSAVQQVPNDAKEHLVVFSGFVIEVLGEWMFVTAGHVLRDIRKAMSVGTVFDIWRFSDYTADGMFKTTGIPMDFDIDDWLWVYDDAVGLDVAAMPLRELYRKALEAGNVMPIPHGAWRSNEVEWKDWAVMGVPYESVEYDGITEISARAVMVALKPVLGDEIPEEPKPFKFYARLHDKSEQVVSNVEGMSGSAIFAFDSSSEDWQYVVIGIQSSWWKSKRIISACNFLTLASALTEVV